MSEDKGKKLRQVWDDSDDEEKLVLVVGGAIGIVAVLGFLVVVYYLLKALMIPIMVGLVAYAVGVKVFDWPVPSFVKKFYK